MLLGWLGVWSVLSVVLAMVVGPILGKLGNASSVPARPERRMRPASAGHVEAA